MSMEEELENADSQTGEVEVETTKETTETEVEDKTETEEKGELTEREKQLLARAKKAESKLKEFKKPKVEIAPDKPSDEKDERIFFLENPDLKEQKDLIKSFQKAGQSLEETLKNPIVKKTLDDLKALKENQSSKSVIHNNNRIATGSDGDKLRKEAEATGNWAKYLTETGRLKVE